MHAQHLPGPAGCVSHAVDVEIRGIAGNDGVGQKGFVEAGKYLLFQVQVLVDGFHRKVRPGKGAVVGGGRDQPHAVLGAARGQPAALFRTLEVPAHDAQAPLQRFLPRFQHGYRNAGDREIHGDAAAHCSAADHRAPLDRAGGGPAGAPGRGAFGEENVRKRLALRVREATGEPPPLLGQPGRKVVAAGHRLLNTLHDQFGRMAPPHLAGNQLPRPGEDLRRLSRPGKLSGSGGNLARHRAGAKQFLRIGAARFGRLAFKQPVGQADLNRP